MSLTNDSSKKLSSDSSNNASNTCIVYYKNVEFYNIGMCEHPVYYECSTRMRVLCQQNECPICRQDPPKVVFTKEIKPFCFLKKGNLVDSKYNIYFDIINLKEHMRRKHDLHYCNPCVENLKSLYRKIPVLLLVCQCMEASCRLASCQRMKRAVMHIKTCKKLPIGGCLI
ncbi:E3 ubiquitin-protein ligase ZNF598-like isoform X2 [Nasonia vitripennis]|uniref:TAZ-type domain-containing protein n=1 Tax=Nasonia vitripennis TaxID=7425 RepID=A0A7M7M2G0_NASVI|nr:E3 ubiquitin-protein ligase ZNF598-like isoform X1 [Nasonia vitripennis]XP_031778313.1 E3 ubiquitin-protein ligase ZNF598-like isoform X2 [Nasonia vitripennis]